MSPERMLIVQIFRQAVDDILAFPHPIPDYRYRVESRGHKALDAIKFIDRHNQVFRFYCELLGYDPDYAEYKILKRIRRNIQHRGAHRKI